MLVEVNVVSVSVLEVVVTVALVLVFVMLLVVLVVVLVLAVEEELLVQLVLVLLVLLLMVVLELPVALVVVRVVTEELLVEEELVVWLAVLPANRIDLSQKLTFAELSTLRRSPEASKSEILEALDLEKTHLEIWLVGTDYIKHVHIKRYFTTFTLNNSNVPKSKSHASVLQCFTSSLKSSSFCHQCDQRS